MTYTVRPLTPDLWPAPEDLFGEERPASRCWCMYWRIGSKYRKRPREANKAALCDLVMSSPLQAYWPSTVTWPWAGASQPHGMPWRGLRIAGASGA